MRQILNACVASSLIAGACLVAYKIDGAALTDAVMLSLLAVVAVAYYFGIAIAVLAAVEAFLSINYFFIDPRFTFEVANAESWFVLFGFLVVSMVIASLMRRLQNQKARAEQAQHQAELARELAEKLAQAQSEQEVLETGCSLIQRAVMRPVAVAVPGASENQFELIQPEQAMLQGVSPQAILWCCHNARMSGPGTGNWPDSGMWMLPFERLPGRFPVLIIKADKENDGELTYLRDLLGLLAGAYQRIRQETRAQQAEARVQREAMQNALLASVSHDMRTPLTAIRGAATTLLEQRSQLQEQECADLLKSIDAEAQYLARATENILLLSRLESEKGQQLALDWQAPEEIVGAVLQRYRQRVLVHALRSDVQDNVPLIKGDAMLLSQALGNLIDNALQAHCGSEPILIGVAAQDGRAVLCVQDRGEGFPANFDVTQIRKFQHINSRSKGMGLGLAIVQTIAQLHSATLQLAPRKGGGTRAALIFPAQEPGRHVE